MSLVHMFDDSKVYPEYLYILSTLYNCEDQFNEIYDDLSTSEEYRGRYIRMTLSKNGWMRHPAFYFIDRVISSHESLVEIRYNKYFFLDVYSLTFGHITFHIKGYHLHKVNGPAVSSPDNMFKMGMYTTVPLYRCMKVYFRDEKLYQPDDEPVFTCVSNRFKDMLTITETGYVYEREGHNYNIILSSDTNEIITGMYGPGSTHEVNEYIGKNIFTIMARDGLRNISYGITHYL